MHGLGLGLYLREGNKRNAVVAVLANITRIYLAVRTPKLR